MDYAKAVKELRKKLLVSQMELAEMLGVSFATVNRWERGRYEPSYKAKRKLRELFKKNGIVLEENHETN
jgi:putative transcriptional regulator